MRECELADGEARARGIGERTGERATKAKADRATGSCMSKRNDMRTHWLWTALVLVLCLPQSWAQESASHSTDQTLSEIRRLCQLAQKDYSPKYGVETNAVKLDLVAKLQEYQREAECDPSRRSPAREFSKSIDIPRLISLASSSPTRFRDAIQAAQVSVQKYVDARVTHVEKEKSLNVLMNYYLSVVAREASDAQQAENANEGEGLPEPDPEIEAARRENFCYYCDQIAESVESYFNGGGDDAFVDLTTALGEALYYQPESPCVVRLVDYLRALFAGPNVYFEANERFLTALTLRDVSEDFPINENIRGSLARGAGSLRGRTYVDLRPNSKRGELVVVLNANVATNTVGSKSGVNVRSVAKGSVLATKQIFLNDDGSVTTSRAGAQANMKTTVQGITTNFATPFGGAIVKSKVGQEMPYSEREGNERMRNRVAQELEKQANDQIFEMNRRFSKMTSAHDSMVRDLSARTTEKRFYLSCVVGKNRQLTTPKDEVAKAAESRSDSLIIDLPDVDELSDAQQRPEHSELLVHSRMSLAFLNAPYGDEVAEESSEDESDVLVRFHQSAPSNAAAIALAGVVFGPGYDALDDVLLRFPGVDPADVRKLLEPYEPKEERPLDPEDNYKRIFVRFDEVRPFTAEFKDDKIVSSLHISSCDVDGKEWGPVDVQMTYRLEKRDASFVFVREEVEVIPGGYQEGDAVSARFNTFRRIFIRRLETAILDEYPISPIPVETIASTTNRGALIVSDVSAQDGWLTLKFRFEPNYSEEEIVADEPAEE